MYNNNIKKAVDTIVDEFKTLLKDAIALTRDHEFLLDTIEETQDYFASDILPMIEMRCAKIAKSEREYHGQYN